MKKILLFLMLSFILSPPTNAAWVRSYIKKDGTFVSGHYRRSRGISSGGGLGYFPNPHKGSLVVHDSHNPIFKYPLDCKNSVITTDENILDNNGYTYINPPQIPNSKLTNTTNWLNIYKKAAILNGDLSYLDKAKYISQFKDGELLWDYIQQQFIFCHEEACFVKWMSERWNWDSINKKIDNIYNYITK